MKSNYSLAERLEDHPPLNDYLACDIGYVSGFATNCEDCPEDAEEAVKRARKVLAHIEDPRWKLTAEALREFITWAQIQQ